MKTAWLVVRVAIYLGWFVALIYHHYHTASMFWSGFVWGVAACSVFDYIGSRMDAD